MPRPKGPRWVGSTPTDHYFKPRGVPSTELEEVTLDVDEVEALRLADLEGLYHEDAASQMLVSRQTFGRIVATARHKVADALLRGKALRIDPAAAPWKISYRFACSRCRHTWRRRCGRRRPEACPSCTSHEIRWLDDREPGRPPQPERS